MAFFSNPVDPSAFDMCGSCGRPRVACRCGSFRLFTDEDFNRWLARIATPAPAWNWKHEPVQVVIHPPEFEFS